MHVSLHVAREPDKTAGLLRLKPDVELLVVVLIVVIFR